MVNSKPIAVITYVEVKREVGYEEVEITHLQHSLQLFDDSLSTSTETYPLTNIWDISWKSFSDKTGLLYLHTNQGVFTYKIQTTPDPFIKAFRRLKGKL